MTDDLLIVGGGVMGLMTAYHASERFPRVTVLERDRIGNPMTASFGKTRSYRSDYLDPVYARFAREALRLWGDFEQRTGATALIRCGGMNIAKASVTPDLDATYALMSHRILTGLGLPTRELDREDLLAEYPALDADLGRVDVDAGVVDLATVTATLLRVLGERGVRVHEGIEVDAIDSGPDGVEARSGAETFTARALVVTAGHGTNDVLGRIAGADLRVPITKDRPIEARYFTPRDPAAFRSDAFPVIAYLDAGIYLHPIVDGVVDKVKIGFYHPPDLPRTDTPINGIDAFVELCMPGLRDAASEPVTETDGCDYDLVADDDFVLGAIPGVANAYVGVGWRGTGYKFSPWVGRVLAELALQDGTVYGIDRFNPARFAKGGAGHASVSPDPAAASL